MSNPSPKSHLGDRIPIAGAMGAVSSDPHAVRPFVHIPSPSSSSASVSSMLSSLSVSAAPSPPQSRSNSLSSQPQVMNSIPEPIIPQKPLHVPLEPSISSASAPSPASASSLVLDYEPSSILLTGGAGFIASHVLILLAKRYPACRIINLDKLDYCASLKNLSSIEKLPNYSFVHGNILNADLVRHILETEKVDTILHFAAQTHVDNSFGNSISFTENNIRGTHVLLECARVYAKIRRFIHVSTDEVYGEICEGEAGAVEDGALDPTNPYAATKAGAEFLVKAYHRSFRLPTIITRSNNIYGPHQYPEKLIPKFICRLRKNMPVCIHGDGSNRRMFLYVEDVAEAFDTILRKGRSGEIYNIGSSDEFSVLQVANQLFSLLGIEVTSEEQQKKWMEFVEDRAFNDCRYFVNSEKVEKLGWKAAISWEEGLRRTIAWYDANVTNWPGYESALAPHPKINSSSDI